MSCQQRSPRWILFSWCLKTTTKKTNWGIRVELVWFWGVSVNIRVWHNVAGNLLVATIVENCLVQSLTVPFILSNHLCVAHCAVRTNVPNGIVRYVWFDSKVSYQCRQVLRWWLLQGWQRVPLHCSGHGMCALLLFGSESLSAGLHRGW